nr:NPF-1 [Urechis unicinctus]
MDSNCWYRFILVAMAAVLLLATCGSSQDLHGPPERPKVFRNPDELRDYLKALNEYFAIVGRPRFGKRMMAFKRAEAPSFGEFDVNGNGRVDTDEYDGFAFGFRK